MLYWAHVFRLVVVAEGHKLFATLTQKSFGIVLAAWVVAGMALQPAAAQVRFASKEQAFAQGLSAYKGRKYEIAVPALKFAARRDVMRAKFYLAKIYSDNSGGFTDHPRAYEILSEIAADYANVDPKDFRKAPYASKALISVARYERDGIPALGLKPNTKRALAFFDHAASHFNDPDAQFELAKHYLAGDGVVARVPYALNWLARLSKRGHAGAQAFLANLYWDGRYTVRDPVRALALITVAVENARDEDRFWIEDVHQSIFCEADAATRIRVHEVVGGWRKNFGRAREGRSRREFDLGSLGGEANRVCSNGDIVGVLDAKPGKRGETIGVRAATAAVAAPTVERGNPNVVAPQGSVSVSTVRPDNSDRRSLNGFVLRKGVDRLPDRGRRGSFATTRTRREDNSNRSLNGFVLRGGSTSFGFSVAPKR